MASIQQVSELVERFLCGGISASDLANSFPPVLKSALNSQNSPSRNFALAVHAQISHHFHGLISEQELRESLGPFGVVMNRPVLSISYPSPSLPTEPSQAFATNESGQLIPVELVPAH